MPAIHTRFHRAGLLITTLAALAVLPAARAADQSEPVTTARDLYKEYIDLRKIIGEETTAWESQKVALTDMISVLKAEQSQLETSIADLKSSATTADQKRADLNKKLEASRATSVAFNDAIASLETDVKGLSKKLPEPLAKDLQPLLARIPTDPADTKLSYSQRLQSVIGVLAQTDKFNTDVKFVSAVQQVGSDSFEVQTLYFGLGAALFTDASGKYAGYGHPTDDGWKWETVSPTEAQSIALAVDTYLSRKAPAFVPVPLKIN